MLTAIGISLIKWQNRFSGSYIKKKGGGNKFPMLEDKEICTKILSLKKKKKFHQTAHKMLKEKKASQTVIKQITNQPRHFSKMCYFTIFLHHFLAPLGIVILFEIQNNHFSRNKKGE